MNRPEAQRIIETALNHSFNEKEFLALISNLFKDYQEDGFEPNVKDSFAPFVSSYKRVGQYKDSLGNDIGILTVRLRTHTSLERARTAQRNFVADYLKSNRKEAALVAFISPSSMDWRLSLVKLDHSLEVINEKLKTKIEITPAKRWSFLVGENEGSHTAQSRLINLLLDQTAPNLHELELAFDIEKVTKEFFDRYTDLYFRFKEHLDALLERDAGIKDDFENKEISTVDFSKKTLGQIVFLYFLQKKGWFGVASDKQWGQGPKKFIRELFERREKYGNNFFNDILEPLFYEALAQDRGEEAIYPRLNNCRMPFLNGGLFEPMNGYMWETTDIVIPDDFFSNNRKTKEGDVGDGILDVFDRYNFTVNENEPLEKEVAVDPEMLGKVFENLLDIKDRKSKGAFYTPREIVHYMCKESLINYLYTETTDSVPREDIELLINQGDRIIENDKITLDKVAEKGMKGYLYKGDYKLLLPESLIGNAEFIDKLLSDIKVADPAVGSGAFPLGMINEIVRARKVLNIYLSEKISDYDLKRHAISHSIYGVDIDPGAVEIAKLRLWLALVVDENEPHPLPNLDHKIMQGNSLISEYEGIKLFDDTIFEKEKKNDAVQLGLGLEKTSSERKMDALQQKIEQFIDESQRTKKQQLKKDIDEMKWELIEATLQEQKQLNKLDEIKVLRKKNIRPFFIWKLEYSDVFKKKGGFDVVIGNPPYEVLEGDNWKSFVCKIRDSGMYSYSLGGKLNLYRLFIELGYQLLKSGGVLTFIVPSTLISDKSTSGIRRLFKEKSKLQFIIEFPEKEKVFETATQATTIFLINKMNQEQPFDLSVGLNSSSLPPIDKAKVDWSFISKMYGDDLTLPLIKTEDELQLLWKIHVQGTHLDQVANLYQGDVNISTKKYLLSDIDTGTLIVRGEHIQKYVTDLSTKKMKDRWFIREENFPICNNERLVCQNIANMSLSQRIICSIIPCGVVVGHTANCIEVYDKNFSKKYVLALLNSKLLNWYFKKTSTNNHVNIYELEKLPIKKISHEEQQPLLTLVETIIKITSLDNHNPKEISSKQKELEKQIDEMVMDLYELTEEEKEIIRKS